MKRGLVLLAVIIPVMGLLYFGLTRNPRELPSALIGKPAPDFALATLEGDPVNLAGFKGSPVVLNFWSTWCGPCLAEHRLIQQAQKITEGTGIRFYSILYEDTVENAAAFIDRFGKGPPILIDPELKTAIDYGVSGVPETFFVDPEGRVANKIMGALTPETLLEGLKLISDQEVIHP